MFNINGKGINNLNIYLELIRMFDTGDIEHSIDIPESLIYPQEKKEEIKRFLYHELSDMTGTKLPWGILTGVKPLKLFHELGSAAETILQKDYYVAPDKIDLLKKAADSQSKALKQVDENEIGIYIGIPFCPSRCSYCSFTSNQEDYAEIFRYMETLYREIDFVSEKMHQLDLKAESIYIGGGTPTTLIAADIDILLTQIKTSIPMIKDAEITIEAGRPDTINEEKLSAISNHEVRRISVNPQTMNDDVLSIIGREHDSASVIKAVKEVKKSGIPVLNMDLIAGLPNESMSEFMTSLETVTDLEPENITLHTLAVKKGSRLIDKNKSQTFHLPGVVSEILDFSENMLENISYRPYYLYRQKNMTDNLENVGYAKPDTECVYNMRIMEENQTIIAIGAGGSSKVFFPKENRLERTFNVSNYSIYIDRIDEMLERKTNTIFKPLTDYKGRLLC